MFSVRIIEGLHFKLINSNMPITVLSLILFKVFISDAGGIHVNNMEEQNHI